MTRTGWLLAAVVSLVLSAPNLALAEGAALESFHPGCNSMSRSRDPDCVAAIHRFCTGYGGAGISQEVGGAVFGVACFAPSWYGDVPLSQLTQQHPGCRQLSEWQTPDCMAAVHRWCHANKNADGGIAQEIGNQVFGIACFRATWSGDKSIVELHSRHPGCDSTTKSESAECVAAIHRSCSAANQGSAGLAQEVGANALGVACLQASWYGNVPVRGTDVPTTRRSAARDGVYYSHDLTTSNVGALYKKATVEVNDKIVAQPLVVGSVATVQGTRSVAYVATAAGTLYAFDAQNLTPVWGPVELVKENEKVVFTSDFALGILGTPVIDIESNAMFVVAQSCRHPDSASLALPDIKCGQTYPTTKSQMKNCKPGDSVHTLFRVDIRNGTITKQTPIVGTDRDGFAFDSSLQLQRPGLLVANKLVYVGFGGQECDFGDNHGWIFAYDTDLNLCSAFNTTPHSTLGSIWQSGAGIAADASGNVYVETGNGAKLNATGFHSSILKFSASGGCSGSRLPVPLAYLAENASFLNQYDLDLGSSGPVVLPSERVIAGSKQGKIYVLDTNTMKGEHRQATCNLDCRTFSQIETDPNQPSNQSCPQSCPDPHIQHDIAGSYPHIHGSPIWWDERSQIFVWGEHDYLRRLTLTPTGTVEPAPVAADGQCTTTGTSHSSSIRAPACGSNGGVLSLSIGGDGSAILWATIPPVGFFAFDAAHPDLKLLWSSDWTPTDQPGSPAKFVPPTVAYGNVYLATFSGELDVFGIRNPQNSLWFDITKVALDQMGWGFKDTNAVAWAHGARAADVFCTSKGFVSGQLNGYEALDRNVISRAGVVCHGTSSARHYDSTDADRRGSSWRFSDVNTVGWAQASRLADEYCRDPAHRFTGGQFNGQQSAPNGIMGIVCYQGTWFDTPKSQVMLSSSDLNLTDWAEAARAANDWCKRNGHPLGGQFNGWQSNSSFGTVCY